MSNTIRFAMFNAGGIERSVDDLIHRCEQNHIDFILITETYLLEGAQLNTTWFQHHNHATIHGNALRGHGGLSLLVRPTFPFHIHPHLPHRSKYVLTFSLGDYKFHGVYFPPHSLQDAEFRAILQDLPIDDRTFIFGDFNTRLGATTGDTRSNRRAPAFNRWLQEHNLVNWNARLTRGQPTRRLANSSSIIDYFISSATHIHRPAMKIFDHLSLNSDHHLCSFRFEPLTPIPPLSDPNAIRQQWKLQRLDEPPVLALYIERFISKAQPLANTIQDLHNLETVDVDAMERIGTELVDCIHTALDESVTRGQVRPKTWKWFWTEELQAQVDKREELYRRWRNSSRRTFERAALWREYQEAREQMRGMIRKARHRQWKQYCINMSKAAPNEANAIIKRVRTSKERRKAASLSHPLGPSHAAEDMVTHLATVFGGEQQREWQAPRYPRVAPPPSLFDTMKIAKLIKGMAPRKAPGMDHITGAMLKPIATPLAQLLNPLLSLCWRWSWIPLTWRSAQVVPIFKKGNPSLPANYRPISLTTTFRKILERCLLPTLLEEMPSLDIAQGGFRMHRGAQDQAFNLHMMMRFYQRQWGELPVVAFLDIKAAYDSVNRNIIWEALQGLVSPGLLDLLRCMFDKVRISVILNSHQSSWIRPRKGVLQGSILSPMLYAIFIDSLPRMLRRVTPRKPLLLQTPRVDHLTEFENNLLGRHDMISNGLDDNNDNYDMQIQQVNALLYADDVAIIGSRADMVDLLAAAGRHSTQNGYRWHPGKCVTLNGNSSTNEQQSPLPLELYNEPITNATTFTYLGIPFNDHGIDASLLVKQLTAKANRASHLLKRIGNHQYAFGLHTAIRNYRTFIRPVLEYGLAITVLNQEQLEELNKAQVKCIRHTLNVQRRNAPTIVQLHMTDLPSMRLRASILKLKFVNRAMTSPATTLIKAVMKVCEQDEEWIQMTSGEQIFCDLQELTRQLPLPRHPLKFIIDAHRTQEMQTRREQYKAVARARPERMWDPILYLPVTSLQRHRLIKWRTHWLPSYPLGKCRCGVEAAHRDHYDIDGCPRIEPMIQYLHESLGPQLLATKPEDTHLLDFIMNMLPRSTGGLKGHWRRTWPALLNTLRDIDVLTHPEEDFEFETAAQTIPNDRQADH